MKVKVCGITNIEDASYAVEKGADALGFIFYEKSKRYIKPETAKEIIDSLPFFVFKVGVFVNEEIEKVNSIASELRLNAVQLHGNEDLDYCSKISTPIIKAIAVDSELAGKLNLYSDYAILLDTKSEQYGGSGETFEWTKIPKEFQNRIILAGGVSNDNIEEIYNTISPQAVDLSSSLEIEPGKKDHKKIDEFFNKLKNLRNR